MKAIHLYTIEKKSLSLRKMMLYYLLSFSFFFTFLMNCEEKKDNSSASAAGAKAVLDSSSKSTNTSSTSTSNIFRLYFEYNGEYQSNLTVSTNSKVIGQITKLSPKLYFDFDLNKFYPIDIYDAPLLSTTGQSSVKKSFTLKTGKTAGTNYAVDLKTPNQGQYYGWSMSCNEDGHGQWAYGRTATGGECCQGDVNWCGLCNPVPMCN